MRIFAGRAKTEKGAYYGFFVSDGRKFIALSESQQEFFETIKAAKNLKALIDEFSANAFSEFSFLAPVEPTKIIAVGLNYTDHAEEFKQPIPEEPLIFLKPPSAVIGHLEEIIYPEQAKQVDYEAELAVVIGEKLSKADEKAASKAILGYTCANDVTERFYQKKDGQWTRAKGFDTFAPLGPWTALESDISSGLSIKAFVNGKIKQSSNTKNMAFSPVQIVSFVSRIMTLYPGDVILTGTPSGVGPIYPGDIVEIEIEGIGRLTNKVVESKYKSEV